MRAPKSFIRLFFGLSGWEAAMTTLVVLLFLAVTVSSSRTAARLATEGATQTATLTGMTERAHQPGRRPPADRYRVQYKFLVGPVSHHGTQTVSGASFRSIAIGDQVPVRYWTQDPNLSEVEPGEAMWESRIGLALSLVAALAAFGLGWRAWRSAAEAAWMARNGQRTETQIIDHVQTAFIKGVPLWRARWVAPDGATGASARRWKSALSAVGREVAILVDPQRRRASRLETGVCT